MNIKAFFVDALTSALDLGVARPEDVLKHVTPDVLAQHLPRPLWARVLTACLGAPKVDATLVVETIGVANFAEHIPAHIIWGCIAELGARALGMSVDDIQVAPAIQQKSGPTPKPAAQPLTPPPPDVMPSTSRPTPPPMAAVGPSIPAPALTDLINELETEAAPVRSRTPTAQRFRQSNTGIGRLGGAAQRRPQAVATSTPPKSPRRTGTEVTDTEASEVVGQEIAVDDSQLVDWSSTENTQATDDDFSDLGRKR